MIVTNLVRNLEWEVPYRRQKSHRNSIIVQMSTVGLMKIVEPKQDKNAESKNERRKARAGGDMDRNGTLSVKVSCMELLELDLCNYPAQFTQSEYVVIWLRSIPGTNNARVTFKDWKGIPVVKM